MSNIVKTNLNNLDEIYEFNKVAKQADGAVLYKIKDAVLLATVTVDKETTPEDFLPLTVQYLERSYAANKIPGGFVKRESKPGDFETLTARIVDRALRPLFPKNFANGVIITIMVLSSDDDVDFQVAALHAANAALLVSSLPIEKSVAAIRVAKIDGKIILNPGLKELAKSTLDLLVVGSGNSIDMIEMRALSSKKEEKFFVNEIHEDELIAILKEIAPKINNASSTYSAKFKPFKAKELFEIEYKQVNQDILDYITTNYQTKINEAILTMSKSERTDALDLILDEIYEKLQEEYEKIDIKSAFYEIVKKYVRTLLLKKQRLDGRAMNEVRPIEIETNFLPSVHGSVLFTRGETQALVTATLGDKKDAQMYELLTSHTVQNENFMVHYNFPPFSVGEAKPIGAPSRRELGHGNLAKRALEPTLELEENQTIRLVSEILESNGSSSMATVCGGSLALYTVQANVKKLVAGIAMGVIIQDSDNFVILTDIMGIEDHFGDMDLKVAGTKDGITAMQLDIKVEGLNLEILTQALKEARRAHFHILEIMKKAKEAITPNKTLPSSISFEVLQSDIPIIIGKGGTTIKSIIEKFGVAIDIDRNKGIVKISGSSIETIEETKEYILELLKRF